MKIYRMGHFGPGEQALHSASKQAWLCMEGGLASIAAKRKWPQTERAEELLNLSALRELPCTSPEQKELSGEGEQAGSSLFLPSFQVLGGKGTATWVYTELHTFEPYFQAGHCFASHFAVAKRMKTTSPPSSNWAHIPIETSPIPLDCISLISVFL